MGGFHFVETESAPDFLGAGVSNVRGLTAFNGDLYTSYGRSIYRLNPATGVARRLVYLNTWQKRAQGFIGDIVVVDDILYVLSSGLVATSTVSDWADNSSELGIKAGVGPIYNLKVFDSTPFYRLSGSLSSYQPSFNAGIPTVIGGLGFYENSRGIAEINGIIYMVGSETSSLYTIDRDDGSATLVGRLSLELPFGLAPLLLTINPRGLANIGGSLYMIDRSESGEQHLVRIDPSTALTMYTDLNTTDVSMSGLAAMDNTLYAVGEEGNFGARLYTINRFTGEVTRVGGIPSGTRAHPSDGLFSVGEKLYGIKDASLFEIDPDTGYIIGIIGSSGFGANSGRIRAATEMDGVVYMIGYNNGLYELDVSAGVAQRMFVLSSPALNKAAQGLGFASVDGMLYLSSGNYINGYGYVYSLNVENGEITRISSRHSLHANTFSDDRTWYERLAARITNPTALTVVDGRLFGLGFWGTFMKEIDPNTGLVISLPQGLYSSLPQGLYSSLPAFSTATAPTSFGRGEFWPVQMTSIGTTFYVYGAITRRLYKMDMQ